MAGPHGKMMPTAASMLLLWVIGVLPSIVLLSFEVTCCINFVKVFPVFMLPPFYVGATACDLFLQYTAQAQPDGYVPVGDTATPGGIEGRADGVQELQYAQCCRLGRLLQSVEKYFLVVGEGLFVGFLLFVLLVSYPQVLRLHVWSLVFGIILFLWSCATDHKRRGNGGCGNGGSNTVGHSAGEGEDGKNDSKRLDDASSIPRIGVVWLLETDSASVLGDISLVAFSLQCPLSKVRSPSLAFALRSNLMPPSATLLPILL
jgi:4-amino-4-deoxy-L-arabinose transferase-like glycosyltransferase